MLFISHDLPVIRQMCDRVGVMRHGKLLEVADTETLFEGCLSMNIPAASPPPDAKARRRVVSRNLGRAGSNGLKSFETTAGM